MFPLFLNMGDFQVPAVSSFWGVILIDPNPKRISGEFNPIWSYRIRAFPWFIPLPQKTLAAWNAVTMTRVTASPQPSEMKVSLHTLVGSAIGGWDTKI